MILLRLCHVKYDDAQSMQQILARTKIRPRRRTTATGVREDGSKDAERSRPCTTQHRRMRKLACRDS
jgi:hypothetical protein